MNNNDLDYLRAILRNLNDEALSNWLEGFIDKYARKRQMETEKSKERRQKVRVMIDEYNKKQKEIE
jgi:hypothetical protein